MDSMKISIELTVKEWNIVLFNLSRGVYADVSDIITSISSQAKEKLPPPDATTQVKAESAE